MNLELAMKVLERLSRSSAQGAVLVLLVLLAQWLFRNHLNARWRCALWYLVLARLLLPISWPAPTSIFNLAPALPVKHSPTALSPPAVAANQPLRATDREDVGASAGATEPPLPPSRPSEAAAPIQSGPALAVPPPPSLPARSHNFSASDFFVVWPLVLLLVWLAGALSLAFYIALASLKVARQLCALPEVKDPMVLETLEYCRTRMGVRTQLHVLEGPGVRSPALYGILRPRLLLPIGFKEAFSREELQHVFFHELAHVKRGDVLLNWLLALLQVMHWFNPLLWLGFARCRADRELACDALALEVAGGGNSRNYGRTVLRLLEGAGGGGRAPGLVGILEDQRELRRRIAMIAAFVPNKRRSVLAVALLAGLAIIGLTDGQSPGPKSATERGAAVAPPAVTASPPAPAGAKSQAAGDERNATTGAVLTRLTAVEEESGQPMPGTRISVSYFFPGSRMERRQLTTDSNGVAVIRDFVPPTGRGINVFVTPDRHVPKVVSWMGQENIPASYTMRLAVATRVAGIVQDEAGQPVSGVTVNLARPGIRDRTAFENVDFHPQLTAVKTDREGRWSFHYVPKEFERVGILMQHPDFAVTHGSVPVLKPGSTNAVLVIERGVTIRGRVIGADGQPLVAAEVREMHNYSYEPRAARTGRDGSYTLKGIRPGEIKLIVQSQGLAPQIKTLNESGPLAQSDFTLNKGKIFRGRVVDAEGKPLAGATAQTDWDTQGLRKVAWETKTDSDGRFRWDGAPDERLLFWFEAEGYAWKRGLLLAPDDVEHEIVLERKAVQSPPVKLHGRVVDARTRNPISSFKVSIGEIRGQDFPPEYDRGAQGRSGDYRLTIDTPCSFSTYIVLVEADGYLPARSSQRLLKDGDATLDFALEQGTGPTGAVLMPDGRPAAGALIYGCTLREGVYIDAPGQVRQDTSVPAVRANEQGYFRLPMQRDGHSLIVVHEGGFAEMNLAAFRQSTNIVLRAWGRVEGRLYVGNKPAPDESLYVQSMHYRYGDGVRSFNPLSLWLQAKTDVDGHFVIEKVPPGERKISHRLSLNRGKLGTIPETQSFPFDVKAGETTRVTVGGSGRPVVGRIVTPGANEPIDFTRDVHRLTLRLPDPSQKPRPSRGDYADEAGFVEALKQYSAQHKQFWTSTEGRALERAQRTYVPVFQPDGTFRIDDVPAGTYDLLIKPTRADDNSAGPSEFPANRKPIGVLTNSLTIPEMRNGRSDEPFDLGTLTFQPTRTVKAGEEAPSFEIQTLDGQRLRLTDFKGKYVLLDFWATWCGPCVAELPHVKAAYDAFHRNERFALISLSLDYDAKAPREFVRTNKMAWTQGFLGDWSKTTVPADYAVESIPSVLLIGPDGKIIARDLRGAAIKAKVEAALR